MKKLRDIFKKVYSSKDRKEFNKNNQLLLKALETNYNIWGLSPIEAVCKRQQRLFPAPVETMTLKEVLWLMDNKEYVDNLFKNNTKVYKRPAYTMLSKDKFSCVIERYKDDETVIYFGCMSLTLNMWGDHGFALEQRGEFYLRETDFAFLDTVYYEGVFPLENSVKEAILKDIVLTYNFTYKELKYQIDWLKDRAIKQYRQTGKAECIINTVNLFSLSRYGDKQTFNTFKGPDKILTKDRPKVKHILNLLLNSKDIKDYKLNVYKIKNYMRVNKLKMYINYIRFRQRLFPLPIEVMTIDEIHTLVNTKKLYDECIKNGNNKGKPKQTLMTQQLYVKNTNSSNYGCIVNGKEIYPNSGYLNLYPQGEYYTYWHKLDKSALGLGGLIVNDIKIAPIEDILVTYGFSYEELTYQLEWLVLKGYNQYLDLGSEQLKRSYIWAR